MKNTIIAIVVLAALGAGYYYYTQMGTTTTVTPNTDTSAQTSDNAPTAADITTDISGADITTADADVNMFQSETK